ncbi:transcription cofactor vestigial-like protein 2 [Tubulanus polymorphus]|uniref:transcription cofactor vestigial-like protein 2 n=1 Tax=Tubulanus polymorphus TaxID=672921 RepID=UPI003DA4D714
MSCCVDIMYTPYSSYFPYHQRQYESIKKTDAPRMQQEHLDHSNSPSSSSDYTSRSELLVAQQEDDISPKETRYLTANCLLITYFTGDISAVVDDHFTRALSQPSSYSAENQGSKPPDKDTSPMAQRNFPASFWNSAYQTQGNAMPTELTQYSDPYGGATAALHHGVAPLQTADPWHYSGHYTNHRAMTDLPYSSVAAASSSRFTPHYGSLLMPHQTSSMRSSRISSTMTAGQCNELAGKASGEHWGTDYSNMPLKQEFPSSHTVLSGIDSSSSQTTTVATSGMQDTNSMDLYWF